MSWDPVWESVFSSQAWGRYPGIELVQFVARTFGKAADRSQVRILEAGCGPGANLWFLAREGFGTYGVDGSETAVRLARERLDQEAPGWRGEVRVADFVTLPYPDGHFDAVLDHEAVYCNAFDASRRIYAELARVTKPGGRLFARTFATGTWGDGTGRPAGPRAWLVAEGPMAGKGYTRFTALEEIPGLVQGFRVDSVELLVRTMENRSREIREWLILGTRTES